MLTRITNYLILIFLFLLPWQTRWISASATLNGLPWEYGTLSFYGTEILLWLIVILSGIRIFGRKGFWQDLSERIRLTRRWPMLLLGLAVVFFAVYFYAVSPVREITVQFISRFIGSICLMICLAVSELRSTKMLLAFWGGAVMQGVLATWQFLTQNIFANKWLGLAAHRAVDTGAAVVQTGAERWLRAYGSFGWPNSLAIYLSVALLIGLFVYTSTSYRWRPYILAGQLIIFAGLLFTFSRGALISFVAGFIIYLFIGLLKKIKLSAASGQGIMMVIFGVIFSMIFPFLVFSRVSADSYLEKLSLNERRLQYAQASQMFLSLPVFGVGPGLYTYSLATAFEAPSYGTYQPVHNIYLLSLVELGLPLYILFIIFLVRLIYIVWRVCPLYLSVIAVILVAGLFDHFLWSLYAGQILFWTALGLGLRRQ